MHKGDDMFMSDKQFETFYWPTYRRMLLAFIEEGLVPFAVVEGTYNRRLEYIKDMPKTGMFWLFEKSDMALVQKASAVILASPVTSAARCCEPARRRM
jgi:hypothetical protein